MSLGELLQEYPLSASFAKFAVLATAGECLALRMTTGRFLRPGFGLLPRALAWGVLGVLIYCAFVIFANGAPILLASFGVQLPARDAGLTGASVLVAFAISCSMNLIFAPVLMLAHKLSDLHIAQTQGRLLGYLTTRPRLADYFGQIDWDIMWGLVLRKTIPLFWIPAHTVTFLLPAQWRVGFAALLSVALGLILAYAGTRTRAQANHA